MNNKLVQEIREKGGKIALENWRKDNPGKNPDLSGEDLKYLDLQDADLSNAILRKCKFFKSNLSRANCTNADFTGSKLTDADIKYTIFENANLSDTNVMNTHNKAYAIWAGAKFNDEHQLTQVLVMIMSSCFNHKPSRKMHILVAHNHYHKPKIRHIPETVSLLDKLKRLLGR